MRAGVEAVRSRFGAGGVPRTLKRFGGRTIRHVKELFVYPSLLRVGRAPLHAKFVVFCQGRTGSTLLVQLLNAHPDIRCAGEILWAPVFWPRLYVRAHGLRSDRRVYGCKLKIEHLRDVQRVDPRTFMQGLSREGWSIIHLRRTNVLRQSLSFLAAKQTGVWHTGWNRSQRRLRVDPVALIGIMRARDAFARLEVQVLEGLPHMRIDYEEDMLDPCRHQHTADRVFAGLGLRRVEVGASLLRTGADRLSEYLENIDEVRSAVAHAGYEAFLEGA